jgi:hypothetical protein
MNKKSKSQQVGKDTVTIKRKAANEYVFVNQQVDKYIITIKLKASKSAEEDERSFDEILYQAFIQENRKRMKDKLVDSE